MLVTLMGVPKGVTEKGHADLTRDAELQQSRVKGVAQVVEPDVPDACPADGCFPARFETVDRLSSKGEDQAGILPHAGKQSEHSCGQGNFA